METTLSAVCAPFPLPHVYAKYCSKRANPGLRSEGPSSPPLYHIHVILIGPCHSLLHILKLKHTGGLSSDLGPQITQNNSDDIRCQFIRK